MYSAKAAALDPRIKHLNRSPILALKSLVTAMVSHAAPDGQAGGGGGLGRLGRCESKVEEQSFVFMFKRCRKQETRFVSFAFLLKRVRRYGKYRHGCNGSFIG
jgi:hypothetical protein